VLALGAGGAMAPAAYSATAGPGDVRYSVTDLDEASYTQTDLDGGGAEAGTATETVGGPAVQTPVRAASLRCWSPSISGRAFALSCSGSRFYVYTDCSNGHRYVVGALSGSKRVTIVCPVGTRALRGGAYGY